MSEVEATCEDGKSAQDEPVVAACVSAEADGRLSPPAPFGDDQEGNYAEDVDYNSTHGSSNDGEGSNDDSDSIEDDGDEPEALEMSVEEFFEDMLESVGAAEDDDGEHKDDDNDESKILESPLVDAATCKEMCGYLRANGDAAFLRKYVFPPSARLDDDNHVEIHEDTLRKVLYALGLRLPRVLATLNEDALVMLLQHAMARERTRREPLSTCTTLADVAKLLSTRCNIVVLTGAGISTSLGIPDFRSDKGIYSRLAAMGLTEPQEVFDLRMFREDPRVFYTFSKDIVPNTHRFSPTHAFIKLLQDKDKLLTNYTQNIDNLEALAGIDEDKLVQCHGSFAHATCQTCGHRVEGNEIFPDIRRGIVSRCKQLVEGAVVPTRKRKRKSEDEDEEESEDEDEDIVGCCNGVMKPDIIFFGEALPKTFENRLLHHDVAVCDLLICIGTSLKVAPVSEITRVIPPDVPQVYISRTPCTHIQFDVSLLGDCDDIVQVLCEMADGFGGPDALKHEAATGFSGEVIEEAVRVYRFERGEE
ncbi:NAD-dependent protein deacetylase hst1 [Limtongia smithiae]|uniref:NAD-dependent protein deacetylase hst1 n=1 Tax=Limtongia smithiae TaxID=1125753 RepID=UPI0034CEF4C6